MIIYRPEERGRTLTDYGPQTAEAIGTLMKELVRRAIGMAQARKLSFEVTAKVGLDGGEDLLTNADEDNQNMYAGKLGEYFPGVGLVGEEKNLHVAGELGGRSAFFCKDGIDGTRAYVRRYSHGVGTMLALVIDGVVVAAYVGDINTGEIYGFRPESNKVHRISDFMHDEPQVIDTDKPLSEQLISLRSDVRLLSERIQGISMPKTIFKDVVVVNGSIGISMAQLWKGEVGAAVLNQGNATLWDMCPIWGISRTMGFVFLDVRDLLAWDYQPDFNVRVAETPPELIVVHESRVDELRSMVNWPII